MSAPSAHVDRFAADHLPARERWPDLIFTLPELQYPAQMNCVDRLLDRHVHEGNGSRRCIVAPGIVWTYDDLHGAANRIARVLTEDLGIVPGNRVLLRAPNTPMMAACWFAVLKAGAIAVTTMPLYRATELRNIIEKAQVRHALCDARIAGDLNDASKDLPGFQTLHFNSGDLEERMQHKPGTFDNVQTAAEDVAIIGFTSGTTGKPKAAMHFHRDILATCDSYGKHVLKARADDLFTGSPPLGFTFGLGGIVLFPLDAGASTLLLEKAPPEPLLQAIQEYGVNVVFTAPVAYRAMADMVSKYDVSSLRVCVSAGETLPLPIWQTWFDRTGIKILDGIGSTEMLHIFIGSPQEKAVGGSTGLVVPGYAAEIHDENGALLPRNSVGRLAVKGPTGCRYLDDDRQLNYVQGGWNYPGDAYRQDEDGYFWYVARTDDMIIAAGYNVSGPEVEQVLLMHPEVRECAVVGKPVPEKQTNIVKAYVVPADEAKAGAGLAAELQEFVRSRIAPFKTPREIEFVPQLPRTETGKVQRFRLRERAADEIATS
ncbi:MAG TPA: AMP-binding protein [Candidatus Baltobacteraceae bacterium]|nr:AMP-binding protein [Candidatus Baltobacteraceae bacterium]